MSSTYNELKNDIKCWERMFQRQNARKPTKSDIKAAAPEIQKCYKDYMALKKSPSTDVGPTDVGVDVFGADLNKPKEVITVESKCSTFVNITPNLRKKIELKRHQAKIKLQEDNVMESFGLDTSMPIKDDTSSKPVFSAKTSSFFSKKSSVILKSLENKVENPCFDEAIDSQEPPSTSKNNDKENCGNRDKLLSPINSSMTKSHHSDTRESFVFDLSEENSNFCSPVSKVTKSVVNPNETETGLSGAPESKRAPGTNPNALQINADLLEHQNGDEKQAKKKKKVTEKNEGAAADEGNFVRLNMKSKKYRRPGRAMTGEAYKRKQWKSRGLFGKGPPKDFKNPNKKAPPPSWVTGAKSKPGKCFKCGEEGHWANKCTGKKAPVVKELTPEEAATREQLDFSSLEPMMRMSNQSTGEEDVSSNYQVCEPVLDGSETEEEIDGMLMPGLQDLGYSSFRSGQREAVVRILQGKSTLLVLSTGSGKSLVYQLAAYLYHQKLEAITLVISPLISLMDDQIQSLPAKLPGRCIHSHMAAKQKQTLKEDISKKKIPLLLLSPEGLMYGSYGSLPQNMPPIAFVCIDEAHCLSSWSDNFRPAYLRVCDVLRTRYNARCFLGLTATCTAASSYNVCKFIGVDSEEGILRGAVVRDNLFLTASTDQDKDRALVSLLGGGRFKDLGSIIVYCTRRQQCESIATLLRTSLPDWAPEEEELCDKGKKKRKRKALENSTAESYHAGLTPSMRSRVQHHFMSGTLRIVCATVAFGMGLDKANVRSVIHYSMPKSFENYVQEIGRAGRDGRPAHCHIFIDSLGGDLAELSRHAHSNTVDRYSIQLLLKYIFKPCACATLSKAKASKKKEECCEVSEDVCEDVTEDVSEDVSENVPDEDDKLLDDEDDEKIDWDAVDKCHQKITKCPGHSVTFPIARLVEDVDVPEENIATMLTYLELAPTRSWIKLRQPVNATCYIQCYGGAEHLTGLAKQATTVLAAMKFYSSPDLATNELEFPYIELAAKMGWEPYIVRRELRELDRRVVPGFKLAVLVEFKDLSFHVHAPGDLSDGEMDEVTDYLYKRVLAQKNAEVRRLRELHESLLEVSSTTHYDAAHEVDDEKDGELKKKILAYFTCSSEQLEDDWASPPPELPSAHILSVVLRDIRTFIMKYHELPLRGRVIARIFQGISSPNYPATTWGRIRQFWRKHIDIDFDWMVRCATTEIAAIRLRT